MEIAEKRLKKFYLQCDSNPCLQDTNWVPLQTVFKSHRVRVIQILVGSGCPVVESDKNLMK